MIQSANHFLSFLMMILAALCPANLMDNRSSAQQVAAIFGSVVKNTDACKAFINLNGEVGYSAAMLYV
jgi:hypothetical protein